MYLYYCVFGYYLSQNDGESGLLPYRFISSRGSYFFSNIQPNAGLASLYDLVFFAGGYNLSELSGCFGRRRRRGWRRGRGCLTSLLSRT